MLKKDTPLEVTKAQREYLAMKCAEMIAHREEGGKHYIKILVEGKYVNRELKRMGIKV